MSSPNRCFRLIFISLFVGCFVLTAVANNPQIPRAEWDTIRTSPYGITSGASVVIRAKHIKSVQFYQSSRACRYGYHHGDEGLLPQSLWLNVQSTRYARWGARVYFSEFFDIRPYNSVVVWIKSSNPYQLMSVSFEDATHHRIGESQALGQSSAFKKGLVQMVIPLSWVKSDRPLDYSRINGVSLYFGEAPERTDIFVEGLAFVQQPVSLESAYIFAIGTPPQKYARQTAKQQKELSDKVLLTVDQPRQLAGHTSAGNVDATKSVSPSLSLSAAAVQNGRIPVAGFPAVNPLEQCLNFVEAAPLSQKEGARSKPERSFQWTSPVGWSDGLMAFLLLFLGFLWWGVRHWHSPNLQIIAGKVVLEALWPVDLPEQGKNTGLLKKFWQEKKKLGPLTVWLSPFQIPLLESDQDEFIGESFLKSQIRLAHESGISLIPSLCFVRTIFRFETFISNPRLYVMKMLAANEVALSDEELRARYVGYFPLWIPPFWQKKHQLPQKVLLAYGRMPGQATTSDSVQFNMGSADFRAMTIATLKRFAKVSTGVRIEGAAALLSYNLSRFWIGHFGDERPFPTAEFWKEVIPAVRKDHPHFEFFADASGADAQALLNAGFDVVENNYLVNALTNQIRQEQVGSLAHSLEASQLTVLGKSIYDVGPLFRSFPSDSIGREQNVLCAVLLSLLPGLIQHDENIPRDFLKTLEFVNARSVFKEGGFAYLPTSTPQVLAFARWQGRTMHVASANFSFKPKEAVIDLGPILHGFQSGKLYLFNDLLHGLEGFKTSHVQATQAPAVAVLGRDLMESGLPVPLSGLSLRLFSVSLSRPIPNEIPSYIRELRQA